MELYIIGYITGIQPSIYPDSIVYFHWVLCYALTIVTMRNEPAYHRVVVAGVIVV